MAKEKPIELTIELAPPKAPEPVAVIEPVQPIEPVKPEVIPPKPIKKTPPKELPKPVTNTPKEPTQVAQDPTPTPSEVVPNVIAVAPKAETVPIATVPPPTPEPVPVKPVEVQPIDDNALGEYGGLLGRAIAKHKSYPKIAQMRGYQGDVLLDLRLDGDGNVLSAKVKEGSGYESLDKQALEMVRKASPFPAPPESLRNRTFNITVPVSFKLA